MSAGTVRAVAVWVTSGPGLPCGARRLGNGLLGPAAPGKVWLDVCVIGQHLPQMYRQGELSELTAEDCAGLGLCADCLGFGDMDDSPAGDLLAAARGVDQVRRPCPNCGGTGRPALRVGIRRDASGVTGELRPLPHAYVPPLDDANRELMATFQVATDTCLACGMPQDGTGPRGEALHP